MELKVELNNYGVCVILHKVEDDWNKYSASCGYF